MCIFLVFLGSLVVVVRVLMGSTGGQVVIVLVDSVDSVVLVVLVQVLDVRCGA